MEVAYIRDRAHTRQVQVVATNTRQWIGEDHLCAYYTQHAYHFPFIRLMYITIYHSCSFLIYIK